MANSVNTWHLCVSGFLQQPWQPHGIHDLWLKLRPLAGPGVEVQKKAWNSDWSAVADDILLSCSGPQSAMVYVYAFSWGAGYGFVRLAKELAKRSIQVRYAVLSDPVYRARCLVLRWLALVDWTWIAVPANVLEVDYFLQRNSLPAGHRVGAADPNKTYIRRPRLVTDPKICHTDMDSLDEFHQRALEVAKGTVA